ncbi:MAG: hypothetical protein ACK4MF_02730 [Hyphomicrobiaceae bacterium]
MRRTDAETNRDDVPAVAFMLADHLDSALAAAEDLEAAGRAWPKPGAHADDAARQQAERRVVERIRAFEAVLIGRVLRARQRAQELARTEAVFASLSRLFVGGTAPLVDAIAELGDASANDFATGDSLVAYARRRGMIGDEAGGLPDEQPLVLDDNFLVSGRVALGPLVEMVIAFIEALEREYDLYPDDAAEDDGAVELGARDAVSIHDDDTETMVTRLA